MCRDSTATGASGSGEGKQRRGAGAGIWAAGWSPPGVRRAGAQLRVTLEELLLTLGFQLQESKRLCLRNHGGLKENGFPRLTYLNARPSPLGRTVWDG